MQSRTLRQMQLATRKKDVQGAPNPDEQALWAHQCGQCILCGARMDRVSGSQQHPRGITIEHIFPRSMGFGLYANKALSHWECNHARLNTWPDDGLIERVQVLYRSLLPNSVIAKLYRHPLYARRAARHGAQVLQA